jgi:DNA-directed RNA polymerases I, II, and III subunit RPABC1
MDYKEKTKLFKVRSTIIEMLTDRKYTIPDEILSINLQQFMAQYDNNNINFYINDDNKPTYVYFYIDNKSFTKNDFKNIHTKITEEYDTAVKILIIIKDKIPSSTKVELVKLIYSNVQIFSHNELTFNITKNYLVPRHILLNEDEKKKVYKKYNTTDNTIFQKILITDPVAKYYSMSIGDLCRIVRPSPSSGICINYRAVTN